MICSVIYRIHRARMAKRVNKLKTNNFINVTKILVLEILNPFTGVFDYYIMLSMPTVLIVHFTTTVLYGFQITGSNYI